MKSTITITPASNIYNGRVEDPKLVRQESYDSRMDVHLFYNTKNNYEWRGNLSHVSIYDDHIVLDNVEYVILHMLTK